MTWLSVESKDPTPTPSSVVNRKCFPSGRKEGQRWLWNPADCLVAVAGAGVPPLSGTLYKGSLSPGVNTITPSLFHVPPRPVGASQRICTTPPVAGTRLSFESAKKAKFRPSPDQKGYVAPSVPCKGWVVPELSVRTKINCLRWPSATNAMAEPSGEITNWFSLPMDPNSNPSGGFISAWITGKG